MLFGLGSKTMGQMDPETSALEDRTLVRQVLGGEREAFRRLVVKYQARVYHSVLRIVRNPDEAEDVAQETFLKAYAGLERYDARWRFSTWILTIATRTALNAVRTQRGSPISLDGMPESAEPRSTQPSPARSASHREWMDKLKAEVAALGGKMRIAFGMRYEDHLAISEIARVMDSSETSVKVLLHRARKALRERLKEFQDLL
jgi:RNA polymerase sigma-70 factor, ECF subfamily